MKCPKCQTDNPDTQKFCGECAAPLTSTEVSQPSFTKTLETPVEALNRGALFADRYEIIEELGRGGMGAVYRVEDTKAREEIALKLIKPEIGSDQKTIERFRNELTTARKIRHKNVCGMYDLNEDRGTHYITMEYVPGEDLKNLITRIGQLPIGKSLNIGIQICDGLAEAHRMGIIHRDLKPGNIMIDKAGNAKVMDFGIARSGEADKVTGTGVVIGTPEYMSPEQAEAEDLDVRSDIYSLGIILYEMTTGQVPFTGKSGLSIAMKQKGEPPRDPRKLNPQIIGELSDLILKCLEKRREERFPEIEQLKQELERIERLLPSTQAGTARKRSQTSREVTVTFRPKKLLIPALVLGTLAVIVVLALWQPWSQNTLVLAPKIENSIAVISFENQTGDEAFDYLQKAIPELLITSLERNDDLYVATWERMLDLLQQLGHEDVDTIDRTLGFELCRMEGIETIVLGSYIKAGETFATDVKVMDVETKLLLLSSSSKGEGASSIINSHIDELTTTISQGLGIAREGMGGAGGRIADVTTSSMEAYRYYSDGIEYLRKSYDNEARIALEKAVELDPDFAYAYLALSGAYLGLRDREAHDKALIKAKELAHRTTENERLAIEAIYASRIEGDEEKAFRLDQQRAERFPRDKRPVMNMGHHFFRNRVWDKAIEQYKKALMLDPNIGNAHNQIGYSYFALNDFDNAVEHFKKYVEMNPGEPNPLDSLAAAYFWTGQLDEALAIYKRAVEIKSDFESSLLGLGYISLLMEDYTEALKWLDGYITALPSGSKSLGYLLKGFCRYWMGNLQDCVFYLEEAKRVSGPEDAWVAPFVNLIKTFLYLDRGDLEMSRRYNELWIDYWVEHPRLKYFYRGVHSLTSGLLELRAGRIDSAERILEEMKALYQEMTPSVQEWVAFYIKTLSAEIALEAGSPENALAIYSKETPFRPTWGFESRQMMILYNLPAMKDITPRAYERMGDIDYAIAAYEQLIAFDRKHPQRWFIHPEYHYKLAQLYERKGWEGKAIEQYETFLDIWKDADFGLTEVKDAGERLQALR